MGRYHREKTKAQRIAKKLKRIKANADKALKGRGVDPAEFFKGVKIEYSLEFITLCELAIKGENSKIQKALDKIEAEQKANGTWEE